MKIFCAALILLVITPAVTMAGIPAVDDFIRIENPMLGLLFDKKTGALAGIENKSTGDNYIKTPGGRNLFRLYINTTTMPKLAAGAHNVDYGGKLVDPSKCLLRGHDISKKEGTTVLSLQIQPAAMQLLVNVKIVLKDAADYFDAYLSVSNQGDTTCRLYSSFPYFEGIQLGDDAATNLAVNMWDRGYPGIGAWAKNSGGVYGRDVSMQWQCVYEPSMDEGIAFITMDTSYRNKILTCFPGGGMQSLYFDEEPIAARATAVWPSTRVVVFKGNWRVAAKVFRDWSRQQMHPRPVPEWYIEDVAIRGSTWIPTKEEVLRQKQSGNANAFTSFKSLPALYSGGYTDCLEMAMWNEGVNRWPETYGPWMSSGFTGFRSDLGGLSAFEEGVKEVHRFGRRVAMYVAGYGIRTTSTLFTGDDWKKWAIVKNQQGEISFDYRGEKDSEIYGIFHVSGL